jgi:hypothetical protein
MELILILVIFCLLLFLWIFYPWESVRTSKFKKAKEAREARQLIEDAKRDAKDHPLD